MTTLVIIKFGSRQIKTVREAFWIFCSRGLDVNEKEKKNLYFIFWKKKTRFRGLGALLGHLPDRKKLGLNAYRACSY